MTEANEAVRWLSVMLRAAVQAREGSLMLVKQGKGEESAKDVAKFHNSFYAPHRACLKKLVSLAL